MVKVSTSPDKIWGTRASPGAVHIYFGQFGQGQLGPVMAEIQGGYILSRNQKHSRAVNHPDFKATNE